MSLISANPGSSQKDLAEWAGIAGPALVGIVDELEKRELVNRERSATDRRRNMLVLTDKGQRTMKAMFDAVTQIEAPIREALGPEDMQRLVELVDRAVAALKADKG